MQSVRVTIPRVSYVMIVLMGCTGIVLALFTDTQFLVDRDVSNFTSGRWAAVALGVLLTLWGLKGTLAPKTLFYCDQRGVSILGLSGVISWRHVLSVDESEISVGFSQAKGRSGQRVNHAAVQIHFDETVPLKSGGLRCSHAGPAGEHTYRFSAEVTGVPVGDLISRIETMRNQHGES